jgi:aspartokinase
LLVSIHSYAPMAQHPIVAKFGGAVLQSPAGFEALCSRVRELLPTPLVLVISALAGSRAGLNPPLVPPSAAMTPQLITTPKRS